MKLIYRCLCVVLGAVLGAGCSDSSDPDDPVAEYGMPHGRLVVDGRVVDPGGTPLPGIEVSFAGGGADTTGVEGNWAIDATTSLFCLDQTEGCALDAVDVDVPDNGDIYMTVQQALSLVQTEPASGWFQGTWEQHGLDIVTMSEAAEYGPPCAKAESRKPDPKPEPEADP